MKKKTCAYFLLWSGQCLFLLLFGSFALQIIFSMRHPYSLFTSVPAWKMAICTMVLLGIFACYIRGCAREGNLPFLAKYGGWGAWLLCLAAQGLYIFSTYSQAGSDAFVINRFAYSLAHNINEGDFYWKYFAGYQNNIPIAFFYTACYRVVGKLFTFEQSWLILSIVAALFADLAIWWTVQLSRAVCKRKCALPFTMLCAIFLIGLSEESSVFYTDILSLWTIPCGLYFSIAAFDKREKALQNAILAGIVLGVGSTFKPQVLIVAVASFIVRGLLFLHSFSESDPMRRSVKKLAIFLMAICITYFSLSKAYTAWYIAILPEEYGGKAYLSEQKIPAIHWINTGLNPASHGGYSIDDNALLESEDKIAALSQSIRDRLQRLSLAGLLVYENDKVFYAIREGSFSEGLVWKGTMLSNAPFALKLQRYFVPVYDEWKNGIGLVIQNLYLLALAFCLYAIYRGLRTGSWLEEAPVQILSVSMIGAVLFIVLFEKNIRYFYAMLPLFLALASRGVEISVSGTAERN